MNILGVFKIHLITNPNKLQRVISVGEILSRTCILVLIIPNVLSVCEVDIM